MDDSQNNLPETAKSKEAKTAPLRGEQSFTPRKRSISIRMKLIFIFVFLATTPIVFGFGIDYFHLKDEIRKTTKKQLALLAEFAEHSIILYENKQRSHAQNWVSDWHIRSITSDIMVLRESGKPEEAGALGNELGKYISNTKLALDPSVSIVDIIGLDGVIMISTAPERIGHSEPQNELQHEYAWRDAQSGAFGQVFSAGIVVLEDDEPGHSHKPALHYSTPIYNVENDAVLAVMTIHIPSSDIDAIIQGATILGHEESGENPFRDFETLEIYLVNRDGYFATKSRFIPDAVLKQKVDTEGTRTCLEKGDDFSGVFADYRGIPVFGQSLCPPGEWWQVVAQIDEAEIDASINTLGKNVITVTGVSALFAIIISLSVSHNLSNRVSKYSNTVEEIARGNFAARVQDVSSDEIGRAAAAVNIMAEKLENQIRDLNQLNVDQERSLAKIKEKNEEMEKFQKLTVDRELKMIELKKKIAEMEKNTEQKEKQN